MLNTSRKNEEQLTSVGTSMRNLKIGTGLKIQEDEKMELEEGVNNICQDSPVFAFPLLTISCGIKDKVLQLTLIS